MGEEGESKELMICMIYLIFNGFRNIYLKHSLNQPRKTIINQYLLTNVDLNEEKRVDKSYDIEVI